MSAVLIERRDGIASCRIDRPATRNALDPELMEELVSGLEQLDGDEETRCIVIAGTDEVFASGAEVRSLSEGGAEAGLAHPSTSSWQRLAAMRTPLVAAVSGWALGEGCELALACDMVVAAEGTQFGQPEITLGIIPGGGATQRLTRALGKQRAMELVLTGRRFSAEQAAAWGLVNQLTPRADWLEAATGLAQKIASQAPIAVRLAKQAILAAEQSALQEGLDRERELFEQAMATEDHIEGTTAFAQGRKPDFQGR